MNLTEQQKQAVEEISHNLQIIACAGSGKTEVITRRIAHILKARPDVRPEQIVAFTFTEKAAESMRGRILAALSEDGAWTEEDLEGMYIGTIHSFCYQLLRKYCEQYADFQILDTVKCHHFIDRYAKQCGLVELDLTSGHHDILLFVECIEKMVDGYEWRDEWTEAQRVAFEKYRQCLFEHKYFDFSQLIFETIRQIRETKELRDYLETIEYLIVDEYQDIDDLQERLIKIFHDFGANVCVVGDDDQTIYQFRGSNADNMIGFSKRYKDVVSVHLDQNFRCSKGIVELADCVIRYNTNRISKEMRSGVVGKLGEIKALRAVSPEGQYGMIADKMREIHRSGVPYSEMAILVRKRKYLPAICEMLGKKRIPYAADSADYFFEGPYFKRLMGTVKFLQSPDKSALFECWDGIADHAAISQGFRKLRRVASGNGYGKHLVSESIGEFLEVIGFLDEKSKDYGDRLDAQEGFLAILRDHEDIFGDYQLSARIDRLVNYLEKYAREDYKYRDFKKNSAKEDAVQVLTMHKSKGLEFDTVFIPQMVDGEFPSTASHGRQYWQILGGKFEEDKDKFSSDIEDERKLFYVALTRAKRNLFLLYDFSKKGLSQFAREAASSVRLSINQEDLFYEPVAQKKGRGGGGNGSGDEVRELRKRLMDYYGSAMRSGYPMAMMDLQRVKGASDEEVLQEAHKMGWA